MSDPENQTPETEQPQTADGNQNPTPETPATPDTDPETNSVDPNGAVPADTPQTPTPAEQAEQQPTPEPAESKTYGPFNDPLTIEEHIEAVLKRLKHEQAGALQCMENDEAIRKLEIGLEWINRRTSLRSLQGVLGTNSPHKSQV